MSGIDPSMLATFAQAGLSVAGGALESGGAAGAAAIEDENARLALLQGSRDVADIRRAERRAAGEAIAAIAGSGFLPGEGSARAILEQSLWQRELDIARANEAAAGEARNWQDKAAATRAGGRAAMIGGIFNAVSGVLQGTAERRARRRLDGSAAKVRAVGLGRVHGDGDPIGGIIRNGG